MNTGSHQRKKQRVFHVRLISGSLSITESVSHLAIEFDVRSKLHGQVNLAAGDHFFVVHELRMIYGLR